MSRRRWLAGVGGMVLLLTSGVGCKVTDFSFLGFYQEPKLGKDDEVFTGSVETVSSSFKDRLEKLGIATLMTRDDQSARITATTRKGEQFAVVFTRHKTKEGPEATQAHFEWEGSADQQFKGLIRTNFSSQAAPKPG